MISVSCHQLQDEIPCAGREVRGLSFSFLQQNGDRSLPLENVLYPKRGKASGSVLVHSC